MKLISLNLGIKIDNTKEVVDFLQKQDADIVCLQEVADHKEASASRTYRMKEGLDSALSDIYPYCHFAPLFQTKGFSKIDFGGFVEQGNYILSKLEITDTVSDFFHKSYLKVDDWKTVNFRTEDHGRALQTVEIDCSGKTLRIMNIHGVWTANKMGDQRTMQEVKFIIKKIKEKELPTVLVGDFNLLPESESLKILNKEMDNLVLKSNFSRTRPDFQDELESGSQIVDYVFINEQIRKSKLEVINTGISDHLPLCVEFEIMSTKKQ